MTDPEGVRLILILTDVPALYVARLVTLQETVLTKPFSKEQALLHLLLHVLLHLLLYLPVSFLSHCSQRTLVVLGHSSRVLKWLLTGM